MNKRQLLLLVIILIGSLLRFTNLNWDSYQALHPDERNIAWAVTRIHFFDQMNPKFFAYGGLPIYLYRAEAEIIAAVTHNRDWITNWGHINVLGRIVSATLSSASLLLVYAVGSLYFSSGIGLLSAFLLAFSPWAIEQAHFDTTETMLVFFLLLLLKISYPFFKTKHFKNIINCAALSGTVWGLAVGAKTTGLLFGVIPFTALWLSDWKGKFTKIHFIGNLVKKIGGSLAISVTALGFFLLTSPYTILDWNNFLTSMRYESGVALGGFSVPYTLQFVGTHHYLYQFVTMIWQAGPVAILGIIGLFLLLLKTAGGEGKKLLKKIGFNARGGIQFRAPSRRVWTTALCNLFCLTDAQQIVCRPKRATELITFLSFPLIYGLWVGSWYAKFSRYNVPFLPFVTLAAAWLSVTIFLKIPKKSIYWIIGLFVYLIIGLFHLWWGLANWTMYLRPQTEIAASRWIIQNIPPQATIFTEHWNDGLPLDIPGFPVPSFNRELLTVYDEDNAAKLDYYANTLPRGQFIILSTRRMWATMPHLSKLYPLTSRFYEKLLAGELGYREVATFTSYPQLLGISVNDDSAEESLQVFDHPTVRIFQNVENLSPTEIRQRLKNY